MNLRAVTDTPLRAVAYIRVSTEREDMISPELQETAIRDHCLRSGYELTEIITDLDLSGRFWKRRQMERAIQLLESGNVVVVVVWKISRVARNMLDWYIALDRVQTAGGRLESATEPNDTRTATGRFSRGMMAEIAAFESERAGEQWQETHRRRWKRGLPHNGKARLGYTYDREQGFTINPATAPLVNEIFERYISGQGVAKIAAWLQSLGITTLTTGRGIAYYMRSGFAAGYIDHHDPGCTLDHRSGQRCPNIIRELGTHEPIVSNATFVAFEEEQARRTALAPRLISPVSTLSGILICTGCQKRMARNNRRGVTPYFRCATDGCQHPTSFSERKAERLLLEWLPTVADLVTTAAREAKLGESTAGVQRERLQRVAIQAEQALTKLTLDLARGIIPESAYTAARRALEAERDAAARTAADMHRTTTTLRKQGTLAVDLLASWDHLEPSTRNTVIRELCIIKVTKAGPRPTAEIRGLWELSS